MPNVEDVHKLFITFQTYKSKKVLEILRNCMHCLKERLENVHVDCFANIGTSEMYTADEHKMVVSQQKAMFVLWCWKTKSVIHAQRHYHCK
jgi:hypothetical protein